MTSKTKRVCVTGAPGVGKSTVLSALKEHGFCVLGTEEDNLCSWREIGTNKQVSRDELADSSFISKHRLVCDTERLRETMDNLNEKTMVVCGIVSNRDEFFGLFDTILLLQCSPETLIKRLENRANRPFPKGSSAQARVLERQTGFDQEILSVGAIPINAERPPADVVKEVISHL